MFGKANTPYIYLSAKCENPRYQHPGTCNVQLDIWVYRILSLPMSTGVPYRAYVQRGYSLAMSEQGTIASSSCSVSLGRDELETRPSSVFALRAIKQGLFGTSWITRPTIGGRVVSTTLPIAYADSRSLV